MNDTTINVDCPQPRVIESASASTACQTCDSKFAYFLTGGVLGVFALVVSGIVLLLITAFATMSTSGSSYRMDEDYQHYYDYDWDDDDYGWSQYPDEFNGLQVL